MKLRQYGVSKVLNEAYFSSLERNKSYSIRAFARDLDISAGALSQIMNGKRRISEKMAHKIVERLALHDTEKEVFYESFKLEEKADQIDFQQLKDDTFVKIKDWHFYAILSMLELADFSPAPVSISKRLGITKEQAARALDILFAEGIIYWNLEGKLTRSTERFITTDGVKSKSVSDTHKANLQLAVEKLDDTDVSLRDFTSMTLPIDTERLPDAVKMIRAFYKEFYCFLDAGKKDEVYNLSVQLYPLTKKSETLH